MQKTMAHWFDAIFFSPTCGWRGGSRHRISASATVLRHMDPEPEVPSEMPSRSADVFHIFIPRKLFCLKMHVSAFTIHKMTVQ